MIDLSPSALSRSLQGERSSISHNNEYSTQDENDPVIQPEMSTPKRKVRRSIRTKRQQREITPTETSDYAELSEPLTQAQQNSSLTDSMKLMMEQTAQTMKAMQNMMEATAQTLRRANNQAPTVNSQLKSTTSKINSNNNKSETATKDRYQEESNEDSEQSETEQSYNSIATRNLFKSNKSDNHKLDCKLPPYTGSEKWRVWLNRFESVARLANWTAKEKLRQLLPRIHGNAADFVFGQLKEETVTSYETLVAEIESRFGTLENKRVYKTQFNNKRQGKGESLEEYAADIKRLYDWAHPSRDASTRQEDLISKFLQGLWDPKARQYIELHREPSSIEEAVQQVAAYMSVTSNLITNDERRPTRQVKTYEKGDKRLDGKGNTKSTKSIKGNCFICNMPGHFARECPNRNKVEGPQYSKAPRKTNPSPQTSKTKQSNINQSPGTCTLSPEAPEFRPSHQPKWNDHSDKDCENRKQMHLN